MRISTKRWLIDCNDDLKRFENYYTRQKWHESKKQKKKTSMNWREENHFFFSSTILKIRSNMKSEQVVFCQKSMQTKCSRKIYKIIWQIFFAQTSALWAEYAAYESEHNSFVRQTHVNFHHTAATTLWHRAHIQKHALCEHLIIKQCNILPCVCIDGNAYENDCSANIFLYSRHHSFFLSLSHPALLFLIHKEI